MDPRSWHPRRRPVYREKASKSSGVHDKSPRNELLSTPMSPTLRLLRPSNEVISMTSSATWHVDFAKDSCDLAKTRGP